MKGNGLVLTLSSLILLLTTICAASSWPQIFDRRAGDLLIPRQQNGASSSQASATTSADNAESTSDNNDSSVTSASSGSRSGSASVTRSGSASASGSGGNSGSSRNSTTTRSAAIDPRLPPGGVSMITPAATDGMTFVKVGDQVTFAWNYTSLSVSPKYIDVVATNRVNSQTYTIAANQTFEPTQTVTWDTGEYTQTTDLPFVVATYTLMIYDAAGEPTTVPSAGYLGAFSNLAFGVYTGQPYVNLTEFRCSTCKTNGAMSLEAQAFSVLLGTCLVTVFSFTWFAAGFGVF